MKNSLLLFVSCFVCLIFGLAKNGLAHDGWIEVPAIVEKGQPIAISLMLGNHSNEHKSFRLAGRWNTEFTKLVVIDPSGKIHDLTSGIIDLGEDPEKTGPKGPKGFHAATFTAKRAGLYFAVARQERTVTDEQSGSKLRSIRTARSLFAALSVPTVKETKKLKRFNRWLGNEDNLEIVPLINPIGLATEDSVALEVRFKGKPSPDRVVSIIRKMSGSAGAQDFTTDNQGRIRFVAGPADLYLARVKFDEASDQEKSSYEGTYVFQVFNRP